MSSSLKKLPPHVTRELLRHVNRPKKSGSPEAVPASNGGINRALAGCLFLIGTTACFPLVAHWWVGNLSEKDNALTGPQVRRGAFQNSGTKDVGKDPNWDFRTGQYKKDAGYYAIYEEEQKKKLPAQYVAAPDIDKHQDGIEAFAKGLRRNHE